MSEGRRQRVRNRVREEGLKAFAAHEILEFMLYPYIPRKDTVPLAHALLNEFGNLDNVFHATEAALLNVEGMPKLAAEEIAQYREVVKWAEKDALTNEMRLGNGAEAKKYLIASIGNERVEKIYMILLGSRCKVICFKEIAVGTPDSSAVDLAKIVNAALNAHATGVIMAHNHPSGDLYPSCEDIAATKRLNNLLTGLGLKLYDHIIVGGGKAESLYSLGYLDEKPKTALSGVREPHGDRPYED